MELDPRIKSKNDILTCFDTKEAGQFLAQEGYFSDCLAHYRCLASRKYGILTEIKDSDCPFKMDNNEHWCFFIPESRLLKTKQKKSKYVPFETLNDLRDYKIHIGDTIVFFNKEYPEIRYSTIVTEIQFDNDNFTVINITLGTTAYSLETLCDNYIWHCCNNEWVPFGKKVEE